MKRVEECLIEDAAKIIGVTVRQVRRYCKQGLLGEKPGREWRFLVDDVKSFARPPKGRRPTSPRD